jgi:hypothetical protein
MRNIKLFCSILVLFVLGMHSLNAQRPTSPCQNLSGTIEDDRANYSSYLNLRTPLTLQQDDTLVIRLGGTARRVKVRLLQNLGHANQPVGVLDSTFEVPASKIIVVPVQYSVTSVRQISVHGGPNPFGRYPLMEGNGPAIIYSICVR